MSEKDQIKDWGNLPDGRETRLYTLKNSEGFEVVFSDLGATIVSYIVPTVNGERLDVVLGYDKPQDYIDNDGYLGAVVGRVGNRLGGGGFRLGDTEYKISKNEGDNTLHGGEVGFDKAVWSVVSISDQSITFKHVSPDGDQGFPGEVTATITYTLTEVGQLELIYRATTDQATPINLTNHVYFNLDGQSSGDISEHEALIEADFFTPVDSDMLPNGLVLNVANTGLDFREGKPIKEALESADEQIELGSGVDHNFVLRKEERDELSFAAAVHSKASGLVLTCFTTQPAVQFYTGNHLTKRTGKDGREFGKQAGFCLETQHFPNAMVQTHFPDIVLRKGEVLEHQTVFGFITSEEFAEIRELLGNE